MLTRITTVSYHHGIIIPKLDDFFRLSKYASGYAGELGGPATCQDEPTMWLQKLVNWLTTVCIESHKDEAFHVHTGTGVDMSLRLVRLMEVPRLTRSEKKGEKSSGPESPVDSLIANNTLVTGVSRLVRFRPRENPNIRIIP